MNIDNGFQCEKKAENRQRVNPAGKHLPSSGPSEPTAAIQKPITGTKISSVARNPQRNAYGKSITCERDGNQHAETAVDGQLRQKILGNALADFLERVGSDREITVSQRRQLADCATPHAGPSM
jgi:hypothetical protein